MIIQVDELQEVLADVRECPKCRLGRGILIEEHAGRESSWEVVAWHKSTCRAVRSIGPRHLHPVGADAGGDAA